MEKHKFRCSSLGKITVGASLKPLPLTEKQSIELAELREKNSQSQKRLELEKKLVQIPEPKLSEGAKTYIESVWYGKKFDFQKQFTNKFVQKGNQVENASIVQLRKLGIWGVKNEESFSNDWIKGTPDVLVKNPKCTIDAKNVYYPDGLGFFEDEPINDYIWQIHGYNFLTGNTTGFIAKILMNPPADILEKEVWNYWKAGHNEGRPNEKFALEIEEYFNFERLPIQDRVKLYKIETTDEHKEIIKIWTDLARDYMAELDEIDKQKNVKELEFFNLKSVN
jgi:hypothetical protein